MAQNKENAYHGTSVDAADNILKEQHFRESRGDKEWLGTGVYFFPYRGHAEQWLKTRHIAEGTVLEVQLEYDNDQLLDLDDPDQRRIMNSTLKKLETLIREKLNVSLPAEGKDRWKQWCLGCNLYRELCPRIGITAYTFPQDQTGISGFQDNQRQLCVSDHSIIKNIKKVL